MAMRPVTGTNLPPAGRADVISGQAGSYRRPDDPSRPTSEPTASRYPGPVDGARGARE